MKRQSDPTSGIFLVIMGSVFLCFTLSFSIFSKNLIGDRFILLLLPSILMGAIAAGFIVLGVILIVKGKQSAKIKQNGRKTTCEIFNILRVKNGYQMIVTYRGESGAKYKLSLPVSYTVASSFKAGTIIECYVLGEDCYVDRAHIAEVSDSF